MLCEKIIALFTDSIEAIQASAVLTFEDNKLNVNTIWDDKKKQCLPFSINFNKNDFWNLSVQEWDTEIN